jgi:hypothetical protein
VRSGTLAVFVAAGLVAGCAELLPKAHSELTRWHGFAEVQTGIERIVPPERLDRGLGECLESAKACTGCSIAVNDIRRERIGDLWLEALN